MPRLLKPAQAHTQVGGMSRAKFWQLLKDGRIPSVKVDGLRLIRQDDLDAFVASLTDDRQDRKASA